MTCLTKRGGIVLFWILFLFFCQFISCAKNKDKIYGAYEIQLLKFNINGEWVDAKDCLKSNKIAFNDQGITFLPGFKNSMGAYPYEFIDGGIKFKEYSECFFNDTDIFSFIFSNDTLILSSESTALRGVRRDFDEHGKIEFDMFDRQERRDMWGTPECISTRLSVCTQ